MNSLNPLYYDDLDIKFNIGDFKIKVICLRYEPPLPEWYVPNHFHTSYEFHFIPSGKGTVHVDNKDYCVQKGYFYLTGPNIYHEQHTCQENPMSEFSLCIEIVPSNSKCTGHINDDTDLIVSAIVNTAFQISKEDTSIADMFEEIFAELESRQFGFFLKVQCLLIQVLINSARCFMEDKITYNLPPVKIIDDKRRHILDFNFGEKYKTLTFSDLLNEIGVGNRQLNRIIHNYYGTSFKEKLMKTRLENAFHLIVSTDLKIETILERVGFSSANLFYKAFKNKYDLTPGELRKKKADAFHN